MSYVYVLRVNLILPYSLHLQYHTDEQSTVQVTLRAAVQLPRTVIMKTFTGTAAPIQISRFEIQILLDKPSARNEQYVHLTTDNYLYCVSYAAEHLCLTEYIDTMCNV